MLRNTNEIQFTMDPETGRSYPIPAGGSGNEAPPGQPISGGDEMRSYFEEGSEEESQQTPATTVPPEEGSQQQDQQEPTQQQQADLSLAQRYLEGIDDPEVLEKLDPYVRKWDAGVTRRFQELRSQLRPYQELGDPDELSQAAQLYQVMSQDPERVYNALAEALGKAQQEAQQRGNETPEPQRQQGEQDHLELPPEVQERLDRYETVLNHLAQNHLESQKQTQQQREDAELEEYLSNLKTEFGDYDESYVLSQMMTGKSGEEAVKAYQSLIEQNARKVNQAGQAPPVLSGGGSHAQQPINPGELSNKDTQSLVANLMAQAAKES